MQFVAILFSSAIDNTNRFNLRNQQIQSTNLKNLFSEFLDTVFVVMEKQ